MKLKIKMYILSLWLLFCFVIIATIDLKNLKVKKIDWCQLLTGNLIPLICLVMLGICCAFYCQFRHVLNGTSMLPVKVTKVRNRNSEFLAFFATYILPLIFVDFDSKRQVIIFVLLLISMGFMYVLTDMFLSNPTLALLGYRVFDIETENEQFCGIMVSQSEIEVGTSIRCIRLDRNSFFAKRSSK